MAKVSDVLRRFRSLSEDEKKHLEALDWCLSKDEKKIVRGFIKEKKLSIEEESVSIGGLITAISIPKLISNDRSVDGLADEINSKVTEKTSGTLFKQFSEIIHEKCSQIIAPHIIGFEDVKKAVALQLFSPEHIHLLLLGDPGTGKTQILSAATDLAPISAMGLGSGTSGVGLSVTVKGKEVKKGLLPMADNGLCAIDELNLMKEESRAALYNAMEKGFVSYDKGGNSYRFDARISVLATANPKGDKFTAKTLDGLKKQLPFDAALLTRFHLTFFIRKHGIDEFKEISRSLIRKKKLSLSKKEIEFLRAYIAQAHSIDPKIPKRFEQEIVDFIGDIKANEQDYLVEVSPRLVVGFTRLAKASARMELREEVNQKDIDLITSLVKNSLSIDR